MKKIKMAVIANNYGETYDGVGAFAKVITINYSNRIDYSVFSAKCSEKESKFRRFTSFGMTEQINKVNNSIRDYDVVMLEYPFVEWNPLILVAYRKLVKLAKINGVKIILSLHEYARVNRLRKLVIKELIFGANLVLVSNEGMKMDISNFTNRIGIRNIPTNIYGEVKEKTIESNNKFVFFGLVNKTKAFEEMLEAWDSFNKTNTCILYVITGSELPDFEQKHKNVKYIYKASNEEVLSWMEQCRYCVVPVKPCIDMKNATFKTGALAGCICIGKFSDEYKDKKFVIDLDEYSKESFKKAFQNAIEISEKDKRRLTKLAQEFGMEYIPPKVSEMIEKYIINVVEE